VSDKILVDNSISESFEVREGVLHFKDLKAFEATWDKVRALKENERVVFFEKYGIKTYANEYQSVLRKLADAESKTDYDNILANNVDVVKVDESGTSLPTITNSFINHFINRKGLVYIGKILYQFGQKHQKIAFDGKLSTINETQNSQQLLILNNHSSVSNARIGSCTYFQTSKTEGGNRRATASTITNSVILADGTNVFGQPVYKLKWTIRVLGYPEKKNVWGNWVNYSTVNTLKASLFLYVKLINPPAVNPSPEGSKYVNCNYSNEWSDITYDDALEFTNLTSPWSIQAQQYSYVEAGGVGWNTYSTGGVSEFQYACP